MTDKEVNLYSYTILQEYCLKYNSLSTINLKRFIKKSIKFLILDIIKYKIEHNIKLNVSEKSLLDFWMQPLSYKKERNVKN